MDPINPSFSKFTIEERPNVSEIFDGIRFGSRAALSKGLTLIESRLNEHRNLAEELLHLSLPVSGNSIRIGITGIPGVGKSTFIEAFGSYLTSTGKKVAVLAIDPTSVRNKGSILGDKTRMAALSQNEDAFIRPSPSSGYLGGVAHTTRESIILCEAAGYDVILVETVGVGQSETKVKSMVDFFLLLMLAGAGDELQGIKRGIMEMAEMLVINKADGDNIEQARRARAEYKRALHLFPPNKNNWTPKVVTASALQNTGVDEAWKVITTFEKEQKQTEFFYSNRQSQSLTWFEDTLGELLIRKFHTEESWKDLYQNTRNAVQEGEIEPGVAASRLVGKLW